MTNGEETSTRNTAESGARVGIQAERVYDPIVYMEAPDDSPQQKYERGVRFLEIGVPARAREQIEEAIANGYENGEVYFHWALAMLSKRAYRDLNSHERDQLSQIPNLLLGCVDDEWKHAVATIHELLEPLQGFGGDAGPALTAIRDLPKYQRDQVVRHLDLVLTGGAKDNLWKETRKAAEKAQLDGGRFDRVWTYFEPDPAEARVRKPAMASTTMSDKGKALFWTVLFAASVLYFGWKVFDKASPLEIVAYLAAFVAGYFGFRNAFEWHYRALRRRAKELAHWGRPGVDTEGDGEFAGRVESLFKYYFTKYAPEKQDKTKWLIATAHIQAAMRDEIVDLYGEGETKVEKVKWLIRYMARDVASRWANGTLRGYRKELRTRPATQLWCVLSLAVFVLSVVGVGIAVVPVDQIWGTVAGGAFLLIGTGITKLWSRISRERRRAADDRREYERVLADRQAEYERWWDKLKSNRPTESEMEAWLTCDKTILLAQALKHYKLAWRDVIAHAFLQTPARSYDRARARGCPWRYSRYDMRLFLVTQDGMREYRSEFDFEHAVTTRNERNNFRFDAVSSVGVIKTSELSYTLKLRLNNGPPSRIRVTDAVEDTEDKEKLSELNLDAAGFKPTLHILEGIAAEGKGWIERDPQLCGNAVGVSSVIDDI
jgi:hypothetical protein